LQYPFPGLCTLSKTADIIKEAKIYNYIRQRGAEMRRRFWIVFSVFLFLFLSLNLNVRAQEYRDTVRVGLNYGTDAVSSVQVSAEKGIKVGFYANNTFTLLYEHNSSKPLIIRKDSHFVRTQSGLIEYSPTEGVPYAGQVIGPWHLRIGGTVQDYSTAKSIADVVNSTGIIAYVAYENGWQVWTGFYPDQKSAENDIPAVKGKIGVDDVSVVAENSKRLVVYDSGYNVVLMYGGENGYLQVHPRPDNDPYVLSVNGKRYRNYIEIRRYSDSDLTVINILNIEEYLYGVVPSEIEADAPFEAVKAQAVAARTYTLRNLGRYEKWGFDLTDTVSTQVYNGYDAERPASNRAVDETRGKKILYNGSLAQVFYFASSGGMTANVKEVWGSDIPYLVSVPDPYESETARNYIWEKTLSAEEIKKILFASGVEIGDIVSVSAEKYSPSGRVTELRITGTKGSVTYYLQDTRLIFDLYSQKYTIQSAGNVVVKAADGSLHTIALDGRNVVSKSGTSVLSSSKNAKVTVMGSRNYKRTISMSSDVYTFSGRGWGHGVGMSQEGAKGFARNGYTYEQILKHYFQGVTIE